MTPIYLNIYSTHYTSFLLYTFILTFNYKYYELFFTKNIPSLLFIKRPHIIKLLQLFVSINYYYIVFSGYAL